MLIIEGADGVGKTTAALRLCTMSGLERRHMSRPPEDYDHLSEYVDGVHRGVQDRYHLGSIVYGRMLGRGTYPTAAEMRLVQAYLRWQGCLVVVLTADRPWLEERLLQNPKEEMYSNELILDANDSYRSLAHSTNRGEPYADVVHNVSRLGWPNDDNLREWTERWNELWRR
jgi:broad-specificity NMP kinase